jgi:hypothetical protein
MIMSERPRNISASPREKGSHCQAAERVGIGWREESKRVAHLVVMRPLGRSIDA